MSKEMEYELAHYLSKFIVYILIVLLLLNTEEWNIGIIVTTLWFWGINFIARIIEVLFKLRIKHKWL